MKERRSVVLLKVAGTALAVIPALVFAGINCPFVFEDLNIYCDAQKCPSITCPAPNPPNPEPICVGVTQIGNEDELFYDTTPAPYRATETKSNRTISCTRWAGDCVNGVCVNHPVIPDVKCDSWTVPVLEYPPCFE